MFVLTSFTWSVLLKMWLMLLMLQPSEEAESGGQDPQGCAMLGVGITISSLLGTSPPRRLQLSWWNASPEPGDYIALLQTDPLTQPTRPLTAEAVTSSSGFIVTPIQAPSSPATDKIIYTTHCLGYWVAYIRNNTRVMAAVCLRTQPTWMQDLRSELRLMKLKQMFLPGTHDSAAYQTFTADLKETRVSKYSITQEEDVLTQLVHGVRYLDLRVGYYPRYDVQWWANHGIKRIHPLLQIFVQIKKFMQNTNEIVIVDFHEFNPGFGDGQEVHLKLVQLIVTELGPYMALPSLTWDARLEDIWKSGGRLIVSYDKSEIVASSTLLWPSVQHRWGNVQSLPALQDHLRRTMEDRRLGVTRPWAAMAELTPTPWLLVTDKLGGLRLMAQLVNRNVTEWFRGPWGAKVNVVAVDFFRGTNIVEDAISWNRRRARRYLVEPSDMRCSEQTSRHT